MKKLLIMLFTVSLLQACSQKQDTPFNSLEDYAYIKHRCTHHRHCKTVQKSYMPCGRHDPMVYSALSLSKASQRRLLELAQQNVSEGEKRVRLRNELEECTLGADKPPHGICWKGECEILYSWR